MTRDTGLGPGLDSGRTNERDSSIRESHATSSANSARFQNVPNVLSNNQYFALLDNEQDT